MVTDGICFQAKKISFVYFHEAFEVSKKMASENETKKGFYLSVYFCCYCKQYHIGNRFKYLGVSRDLEYFINLDEEDLDNLFKQKIKHISFKEYKKKFRKRNR